MKLIEKKCPNCGASLEFGEKDKSCKCSYCHRSFEIEREDGLDSNGNISDQFNLNELKAPLKTASKAVAGAMIGSYIIWGLLFLFGLGFIGFVAFNMFGSSTYKDVNQFTNEDFGYFDNKAYFTINKNDDNLKTYTLNMNPKRQKTYVVYNKKDKSNIVYVVYKTTYEAPFNEEKCIVYVPIKYENLKKKFEQLIFQLDNGEVEAPEFYLTSDKSEYTYGYTDVDAFEKDVIDKLEKDNTVTQK